MGTRRSELGGYLLAVGIGLVVLVGCQDEGEAVKQTAGERSEIAAAVDSPVLAGGTGEGTPGMAGSQGIGETGGQPAADGPQEEEGGQGGVPDGALTETAADRDDADAGMSRTDSGEARGTMASVPAPAASTPARRRTTPVRRPAQTSTSTAARTDAPDSALSTAGGATELPEQLGGPGMTTGPGSPPTPPARTGLGAWVATGTDMVRSTYNRAVDATSRGIDSTVEFAKLPLSEQTRILAEQAKAAGNGVVDYTGRVANAAREIATTPGAMGMIWSEGKAQLSEYRDRLTWLMDNDPEAFRREVIGLTASGAMMLVPLGRAAKLVRLGEGGVEEVVIHLRPDQYAAVKAGGGLIPTAEGRVFGTVAPSLTNADGTVNQAVRWGSGLTNPLERTARVVLQGEAAQLFQRVPVSGVISASKRFGGQVVSRDVGYRINFNAAYVVEDTRTNTLYVFKAAADRESFINYVKALARQAGTVAKEGAITAPVAAVGADLGNAAVTGESGEVVGPLINGVMGP